jgi:hypothetical protein
MQMALLQRGQLCMSAANGSVIGHFNQSSPLPLTSLIQAGSQSEGSPSSPGQVLPPPLLTPTASGGLSGSTGVQIIWDSRDYTTASQWISVLPVDITNRVIVGPIIVPRTAGQ